MDGFALWYELLLDVSHVPTKAVGFACLVMLLSQVANTPPAEFCLQSQFPFCTSS